MDEITPEDVASHNYRAPSDVAGAQHKLNSMGFLYIQQQKFWDLKY